MDILGFPKEMGIIGNLVNPGMILSTNLAEMNQVHNILIKCYWATSGYQDGVNSSIIAVLTPDVAENSTIMYDPVHPLRYKLTFL